MAAKGVGVGKQQFATVQLFGIEIIIIKFVRHQFEKFENAKTYGNWFIQRDTLACTANERQIVVDDLGTTKSRPTQRLSQFIGVTDQGNVNAMPDLFYGLTESRIRL